jgi:hypothetical protein
MTAAKCANREAANQTLNAIMLSSALLSVVALPRLAIDEYLAARRRSSETTCSQADRKEAEAGWQKAIDKIAERASLTKSPDTRR